ncbi:MAG: F0F1 ATP synthase subunit epsilon [Actinomycetota bacterium]
MPLEVHVVTPEREIWTGQAEMLIARGVDGELGILGGHQPMLVQLAIGPLRIHREGGELLAAVVDGGFLHVGTHEGVTRADVLASQAELADEIDVDLARRTLAELESRDTELDEAELEALKREVQKAQARVKLAG